MSLPSYARSSTVAWDEERERTLKRRPSKEHGTKKNVVYWMSRDQRAHDNWALLRAKALAEDTGGTVSVLFCLQTRGFLGATLRHYDFMLRGLEEVEGELRRRGILLSVRLDEPAAAVTAEVEAREAWLVVCDFSPLRIGRAWRNRVVAALPADVEVREVDAHNVVPVWVASQKQEVGARTIRKKIVTKLPRFLTEFPDLGSQSGAELSKPFDWSSAARAVRTSSGIDATVVPIEWCDPGETAAHAALEAFCVDGRLNRFAEKRNDPTVPVLSNLSCYFHFGHLSPQRAALRVQQERRSCAEGVKSFLEESIVRRELSDNFCLYQPNYDSLEAAAAWARESLELHASDHRPHLYTRQQLEDAQTHEDVWNAAQRQMVRTGKMHGFMRMYWCKKILEWSSSPAEAMATAIYLNDRYSIDGNDPNGYTGIAWSIMGTHDMGWKEREIFGKIRYMNYAGCQRKFNVKAYVAAWPATKGPIDVMLAPKKSSKEPPAKKTRRK